MPCGQCHVANARGQCPWAPLLQVLFALVLPAARSAKLSIIAHADDATNVGSITMSPQDISISAGDRGSTRAAGTRPQLWTQPATEKVLLTSPVPTSAQGPSVVPSISLAAQKGECERAFLVIAGVQGQELHNLSLTFPTVPCAGTEWRYYQQGYMWTNATRNLLWMPQQVNTSGGWYPEPLLPILPGDQIDRVPVGLSQALLVEACVPSMAQAGNYSFEATVAGCYANCSSSGGCDRSCGASFALQLQMNLEVWPIKLVTHQGIQMNLREANLAAALPDSYVPGCYPLTEPRCATNAAWFAFLTKHRMPPSPFPSGDALAGDAPARLRTLLAFAEAGTQLILLGDVSGCPNSNWLGTRCNFTQEVIEQKIDALRPLVGNLSTAGYGDRLAVYGFDEVMTGSPTIHADLYNVFGAVKKAFPRVKTMSAGFGWRSTGAVPPLDAPLDIYVALYYDYCWPDVNTGQAFRGWPNCSIWMSTVRAWRSAGKEFWLYWANEPGSGPGANAHSKGGIWLNTFVQWPTIAARLLFWLGPAAVEGGIDGWYYWAINNWAPGFARPIHRVNGTLYTNASNVQSNSIGDGVLFYIAEDGSPAPGLRFVNIAGAPKAPRFVRCSFSRACVEHH